MEWDNAMSVTLSSNITLFCCVGAPLAVAAAEVFFGIYWLDGLKRLSA
jgi:hypothetical protein